MFERILVAVDGSPHSSKTIPVASDLARRYGATVTVVHVREHERYEGQDVDLGPPLEAEALVDAALGVFREAGVNASGVIRRVTPGHTPKAIIEVAEESQAELIVIGTRGMTELRSLVLGGVANKIVQNATCPVLLVR